MGELDPRNRYYTGVSAYPGFDITWNMVVKSHASYPMLWIDTRDAQKNEQILGGLQDAVVVDGLDFDITWDPKEAVRSCTVFGQAVEGCGWKTPSEERAEGILELVERTKAFIGLLEPPLAGIVDEVVAD